MEATMHGELSGFGSPLSLDRPSRRSVGREVTRMQFSGTQATMPEAGTTKGG
jgi:hypothetical protein